MRLLADPKPLSVVDRGAHKTAGNKKPTIPPMGHRKQRDDPKGRFRDVTGTSFII